MPRVALAIFVIALWIYALIDCARTPRTSMPGRLPKWVWMLLTLVPVLGSLLWLGLSWSAKHPGGLSGALSLGRGSQEPVESGPVAPDDDPEFLAKLEARNRFAEWERQQARKAREDEGRKPRSPQADDATSAEVLDLDAELRAFLEGASRRASEENATGRKADGGKKAAGGEKRTGNAEESESPDGA